MPTSVPAMAQEICCFWLSVWLRILDVGLENQRTLALYFVRANRYWRHTRNVVARHCSGLRTNQQLKVRGRQPYSCSHQLASRLTVAEKAEYESLRLRRDYDYLIGIPQTLQNG
jgi:hypothetical protein